MTHDDPYRVTRTDLGLLRLVRLRGLQFPNARRLEHPSHWKNTLPWHLGPAAKVRILRFKNLPPFRYVLVFRYHV